MVWKFVRRGEASGGLTAGFPDGTLFIGLTSIHWREEWKYGQRAYRYCQHDVGHAVAAVSIAATGLGWQATLLDDLGADELALLMGTACHNGAEQEVPDLLLAISPTTFTVGDVALSAEHVQLFESLQWQGLTAITVRRDSLSTTVHLIL